MLNNFSQFVMDLYDIYSGITVSASSDNLTIHLGENEEILLWFVGEKVFPEIVHDFEYNHAIDLDMVMEILRIVEKYTQ